MISKMFQGLSMIAAIAVGAMALPQQAEAGRILPARGGSSTVSADATCWTPYGPTVSNSCSSVRYWYVPLLLDDQRTTNTGQLISVAVTAEGASSTNEVQCRIDISDKNGQVTVGGWVGLSQYGAPKDILLSAWVPSLNTAMIDCSVQPGGKVHTVNWF